MTKDYFGEWFIVGQCNSILSRCAFRCKPSWKSSLQFVRKLLFGNMATTFWAKCFFRFTIGISILLFVAIILYDIGGLKLIRRMKNNSHPPTNNHLMMEDRINMNARKPVTLKASTRTVVLVYTVFFGRRKWISGRDRCGFETKFSFTAKKCLSGDFELTYDKHRFQESDLVVFHARNMPAIGHLRKLLKRRPTSQRWVYASWESPDGTPNPAPFNGLFNLTWTYRSDSDFLSPYGSYEELSDEERIDKLKYIPDYSQGKTELVAWMVSHCSAQPRMAFVQELKEHIKVDVFGKCSKHFGEKKRCPTPPTDCLKKFKFYLSFENALCEDYITEKYWGRLGKYFFLFFFFFFCLFDCMTTITCHATSWWSQRISFSFLLKTARAAKWQERHMTILQRSLIIERTRG